MIMLKTLFQRDDAVPQSYSSPTCCMSRTRYFVYSECGYSKGIRTCTYYPYYKNHTIMCGN